MRRDEEQYLAWLDDLAGGSARRVYEITDPGEVPPVLAIVYDDIPDPGLSTGFTFGLSGVSRPNWKGGLNR
ncbi:hypothetical protein [Vulgatibacter incomptus]|uniref:hypothetical protein n=1 Tax=Vulgatibacter incomptus TaxID=1391653 RepID=UPI0012FC62C6|nr:hypothetical protein [Vulgatibacter incomptus]